MKCPVQLLKCLPGLRLLHAQLLVFKYRADVIKVEHPVRGDDTRAWGPPYAKYKDESKEGPGESAYYLAVCKSIPGTYDSCIDIMKGQSE